MGLTFRGEAERAAWSSAWDAAITDSTLTEIGATGCADHKIKEMRRRIPEAKVPDVAKTVPRDERGLE